MHPVLAVGLGGFAGAVLRYGAVLTIGRWPWTAALPIPVGVLLVNLLGCLLIGVLKGLADARGMLSPALTLWLFTGVLGSFTTFSTFGLETLELLQARAWAAAALYVGISTVVGIGLVALGYYISVSLA